MNETNSITPFEASHNAIIFDMLGAEDLDHGIEGISLAQTFYTAKQYFAQIPALLSGKLAIGKFSNSDVTAAIRKLNEKNNYDLEKFTVRAPEFLMDNMCTFVSLLVNSVNAILPHQLQPVITALTQLEYWAGMMLSDPTYVDKIWTLDAKEQADAEVVKTNLEKFFKNSSVDTTVERPFNRVYGSVGEFDTVTNDLNNVSKVVAEVLNGKLSAKATSVAKLMYQIKNKPELSEALAKQPTEKTGRLNTLVTQTANNLTMLSVILFHIKTCGYVHEQNLVKIKKVL